MKTKEKEGIYPRNWRDETPAYSMLVLHIYDMRELYVDIMFSRPRDGYLETPIIEKLLKSGFSRA